ncbi:MAG: hypothetical protein GY719_08575 [bacterium]|nr:hypothetical protein [bacterium]
MIVTKQGSVHVAEATPEGYNEIAALPVFEDLSWTAPAFAGGSIYARSFGEQLAPMIVVFFDLGVRGPQYDQAFTGEIVPFIDEHYRTRASADSRANVGMYFGGINALISTLQHPELFAKAATQSLLLLSMIEDMIYPLVDKVGEDKPEIYMDWGTYDMRNPHENWNLAVSNRKLAQAFRDKGVEVMGGEAHDGAGWASWRNRTDRVFASLFPAN